MIISASRRTDIPSFYSDWFINRIKHNFVLVPNPYDAKKISRVSLKKEDVDCIVFWSKNPLPLISKLDTLQDYHYYFQFTLNPYDKDIERNIPVLAERINIFKNLSEKIGKEKVIWRYDPILTNEKYNAHFHQESFEMIASELKDYTDVCMLGFIDHYNHIKSKVSRQNIKLLNVDEIHAIAKSFKLNADKYNLILNTCTVKVDLKELGIPSSMCIDKELIEKITGSKIQAKKDTNQRHVCNCIESIDIGMYSSCANGCIYCYAIQNDKHLPENFKRHDKNSPILYGQLSGQEVITERRNSKSLKTNQQTLF